MKTFKKWLEGVEGPVVSSGFTSISGIEQIKDRRVLVEFALYCVKSCRKEANALADRCITLIERWLAGDKVSQLDLMAAGNRTGTQRPDNDHLFYYFNAVMHAAFVAVSENYYLHVKWTADNAARAIAEDSPPEIKSKTTYDQIYRQKMSEFAAVISSMASKWTKEHSGSDENVLSAFVKKGINSIADVQMALDALTEIDDDLGIKEHNRKLTTRIFPGIEFDTHEELYQFILNHKSVLEGFIKRRAN